MMRPRRRPTALAGAVAALTVLCSLAACVAIPTDGPIGRGSDVPVEAPGLPIPQASDPEPDDTPEGIVTGFLRAGAAGLADEFAVARKFLTVRAAASWSSTAQVLIYPESGGPVVEERPDGSVLVTVPVESKVDEAFRYTEVAPGAREELVFTLVLDNNDQWRISELDDGVVMSPSNFEVLYRPVPVYFASPDLERLVPDLRYFPNDRTATYAVIALLGGPSPWLRDGVVTGAPEGATLNARTVPISDDLEAMVDLSPGVSLTGAADPNLLHAQLEATLQRIPGVTGATVTVGGVPWEPTDVPQLERDVAPGRGPFVLAEARLAVVDGPTVVPVEDAAPLTGLAADSPAISLDETVRVVRSAGARIMLLPADGAPPVSLMEGVDLIAPSVDASGWVWSGESSSVGELRAARATGDPVTVSATFLDGRTIRSLRVARDGTRVAVVHAGSSAEDVVVDVVAVIRDEDGTPLLLGTTPLEVGASLADALEVAWVDEVTVAVLGRSGNLGLDTVHILPLGGPARALPGLDRTSGIAAGRGERAIYLVDQDGVLLNRRSSSWVVVATGVRDPVFPG